MSTSPEAASEVHHLATAGPITGECRPFPYELISSGGSVGSAIRESGPDVKDAGAAQAAGEVQARARGRQEGLVEAQKICEERLSRERASIVAALAQFSRDRAVYFEKIEAQVVQLALAIARKVLHREVQVDPMLLAALVRVALDQIDGATDIVLRLHPQNADQWRKYLATQLETLDIPKIVEDPSQAVEECVLETSMGTTTIGLAPQLKEIEQGLMDLMAVRPGGSP
jgi:flagellar biosynthesis/type III secretory pathway protein FliH